MLSNHFLSQCHRLKELGLAQEFEVSRLVGRGFADLGYEVFCVLGGGKMVSLFTGQSASMNQEDKKHLFVVPSVDEMANQVLMAGFDIISVEFKDQRTWCLTVADPSRGLEFSESGETLEDAFVNTLAKILEAGKPE